MSTPQPIYPTRRAFVVQVHVEAEVAHGQLYGRVEHIVSGQSQRFQSLEELMQFIVEVSRSADDGPSRPT